MRKFELHNAISFLDASEAQKNAVLYTTQLSNLQRPDFVYLTNVFDERI